MYIASIELDHDIIVLTETWLDDTILSELVICDKYAIYRSDRNANNSARQIRGGVLIAVSKRLKCLPMHTNIMSIEHCWVKILLPSIGIFVEVSYMSQSRSTV